MINKNKIITFKKWKTIKVKNTSFTALSTIKTENYRAYAAANNPRSENSIHSSLITLVIVIKICHFLFQHKSAIRNEIQVKLYEPFCHNFKRKSNITNVNWSKTARMHTVKTKVYMHQSRVTDTVPIIYIVEWNLWSYMELMILTIVNSGFQWSWIRYHQWIRFWSKSDGWSGINRKFRVLHIQWNPLDFERGQGQVKSKGHKMKQDENELKVKKKWCQMGWEWKWNELLNLSSPMNF